MGRGRKFFEKREDDTHHKEVIEKKVTKIHFSHVWSLQVLFEERGWNSLLRNGRGVMTPVIVAMY